MSGYDLWVDFNDVEDNHVVTSLAKFATTPLAVGQFLTVGDDDGNTARAVVRAIADNGVVTVHLHGPLVRP